MRLVERALHRTRRRCRRRSAALLRQLLHQLDEALAFVAADQVVGRHAHVVEEAARAVSCDFRPDLVERASAAGSPAWSCARRACRSPPRSATMPLAPARWIGLGTRTMMMLAFWPLVMKVFGPVDHVAGRPRARRSCARACRSEPVPGSVIAIAPTSSPVAILGSQRRSYAPRCRTRRSTAPRSASATRRRSRSNTRATTP